MTTDEQIAENLAKLAKIGTEPLPPCTARSPEGYPCARWADHRGNHYTNEPYPPVIWGYVPPLKRGEDGLWR